MPPKRYRPQEIIAKLRQADVLLGGGKRVPEVVQALGNSEANTPGSVEVRVRLHFTEVPSPKSRLSCAMALRR
jgi:hypothetical protein